MAITFLDYKVKTANFALADDVIPNRNYKINPRIGCSVKKGERRLLVTFTVEVERGKEPVPFEFKITACGSFAFAPEDDKPNLPIYAAETVFPFVRASLASLTQMANVPPYVLPFISISDLIAAAAHSSVDTSLN